MTLSRESASSALNSLLDRSGADLRNALEEFVYPDAVWDVAHPVNRLIGVGAICDDFYMPLQDALAGLRRRDEIFIGGIDPNTGTEWVASLTHYVGNFKRSLFGVSPNDRLVFLRSGEFYRISDGRIVEGKLIVDLIDLMRQTGQSPVPNNLGNEMLYPGPATHDGVLPGERERGEASLRLVNAMLRDLVDYDSESFSSENQTGEGGYWDDDMLWYGPGGIGSNYQWDGFQKDHRIPFLTAFPDRRGGNRFSAFGDGNYACLGGWPSMTMTHEGEYLGVGATGKNLTLRVMDFYRCDGAKIAENWVLLDYLDLLSQMGVDVLPKRPESDRSA